MRSIDYASLELNSVNIALVSMDSEGYKPITKTAVKTTFPRGTPKYGLLTTISDKKCNSFPKTLYCYSIIITSDNQLILLLIWKILLSS